MSGISNRHFKELATALYRAKVSVATGGMNDDQSHGATQAIKLIETSLIRFCAGENPMFDRAAFIEAARYDETEEAERLRRAVG